MPDQTSRETVHDSLRTQLAEILYCPPEEIDGETPFGDLGLDSVLGIELIASINSSYGLHEQLEVVYQNPTLDQLATHISGLVNSDTNGSAP
jgi:acyl carrier protein